MVKGKIIGWNFKKGLTGSFNADGSSSLETLTSEKTRLENRFVEIPKLIAQLKHSISLTQNDINWLNSLSNSQRKKWEKKNGKTVEVATQFMARRVTEMNGQVGTLSSERSRIPEQINNVKQQLAALVNGEATGLELGLSKETAQQLGEMELENEQERIDHERTVRESELAQLEESKEKEGWSQQTKIIIGVGVALLLAFIGYMVYKRQLAKKRVAV